MDWLVETLSEFEAKMDAVKRKQAAEKAALEKRLNVNRMMASECLSDIYVIFLNVKKEIIARNFPCEADLETTTDIHSSQQHNTSVTLVVSNKPLEQGQKLCSGIHPYLTFKENSLSENLTESLSENLSVSFRTSYKEESKRGHIEFAKINRETIEEMLCKFIKGVFS